MKPVIKIEVVSDVVCPWCYIGKRRLEKAVNELSNNFEFDIKYLPFELNSDMPAEGKRQKEYLSAKFGGEEKYQQLTGHMTSVAAAEGISFHFEKQMISPNTRDAHRILWLAESEGKQGAVKEAFLKAYFTDGIDLSKKENLIAVASETGLDGVKIAELLSSDQGTTEVILSERSSSQRGVSGVPFYIVNGKYGISGAQPSDVFSRAFTEIALEGTEPTGETCSTDGEC